MTASSSEAAKACEAKMRAAGLSEGLIRSFVAQHAQIASGHTGFLPESAIKPADGLSHQDNLSGAVDASLLRQTVVLKLNGGLGTGMGLSKAKSLLRVKGDDTFLDYIAKQVLYFRGEFGFPVRFMLMNSFSTSDDTKAYLSKYPEFSGDAFAREIELMQNKVPKIRQDNFMPAEYPDDSELEWCPPGHGDVYEALNGSGKLDELLASGYRYLFVSNSDNLGATLDLKILTHFAEKKLDFLMEVCERSEADKKGGHLARSAETGNLLLRESAQCPKEDEAAFQDISRHKYFNTNNLWVDLEALKREINRAGGSLVLPVIRNAKTVNPTDGSSAKVFQLETAMGSAIASFGNAAALVVSRARFSPVKTCNDLLGLRSDCFTVTPDSRLELAAERHGVPPVIALDDKHYKFVDAFETLIPHGVPSLLHCDRLVIKGKIHFAAGVSLRGSVSIVNEDAAEKEVSGGELSGDIKL